MNEPALISLFERRGYICVSTLGRYHAIPATDIVDGKVKHDAQSIIEVSTFVLDEMTEQEAEQFLDRVLASHLAGRPFDVNKQHAVLSGEKPKLPEWRGWDVNKLRQMFGMDK